MTTTVVYVTASDFGIESEAGSGDWESAADGLGTLAQPTTNTIAYLGWRRQVATRGAYQNFFTFDTSSLGTDHVTSAVVTIAASLVVINDDFQVESYYYGTSTGTGGADWIDRASHANFTKMGSRTGSDWTTGTYYDITEVTPVQVNGEGNSVVALSTSTIRTIAADKTTNDYFRTYMYENGSLYPYITLEHVPSGNVAMFGANF